MQTTKSQILVLLKRPGPHTVDALADELGVAPMTVRQHLTSLERDGFVGATAERQRKGRPHYVYSLTEKGEESFPKHYGRLVAQLLSEFGSIDPSELAGLSPSERTEHVLVRIADRAAGLHAGRLDGCSLENRVREVAAILQEQSGFVEWSKTPDGYEIRDYNCIYRSLAETSGQLCTWHRRLIEQLVGCPPAHDPGADSAPSRCRYLLVVYDQIQALGPATATHIQPVFAT